MSAQIGKGRLLRKRERVKAVLDYLATHREGMLGFASELVSTPSMNPPGDERAVAEVVLKELRRLGLSEVEVMARDSKRPNVVCRLQGTTGEPSLILNGHMDTKPVGTEDRKLWRTDPLSAAVIDDRLYGLGATDMKGALSAIVYAAAALGSLSDPLSGDLLLILTSDEEAPTEFGANWLAKELPLCADFCLVAEPCGIREEFEMVSACARGVVLFKVKVYGTQMHSSLSDAMPSVNASVKMGWVLWRMAKDLTLRYTSHRYYPKGPTVNLGDFLRGGVHYGIYPGYAEFGSDIRLVPGMTRSSVERDLEEFLESLRQEDPDLEVELVLEEVHAPADADPLSGDERFVVILQGAAERVLGRRPPLGGFPAFTDAHWFQTYAGVPSIPAFGPGLLPLAHAPNEYVSLDSIVKASEIYALAALYYLDGDT